MSVEIKDDPTIIEPTLKALKASFQSQKTKLFAFRKKQLQNLIKGLDELEQEFHDALQKDMGASKFHSDLFSFIISKQEVKDSLDNFEKWAKPRKSDTSFIVGPANSYVLPEPLGVVLVISAWNYPLYTAIPPIAQAIAAGNSAILKPSELAPHTSKILVKLFEKYLDPNFYKVIEGATKVASTICNYPFDLIIFTGSPQKGKLVAQAAAQNLVPCILELGGKSPTIVDKNVNMDNALLRIAQGRFANTGQTCVACDYLMVHKDIEKEFVQGLKQTLDSFYEKDASKTGDYVKIINEFHTQRLKGLLDENHGGQVIYGGKVDIKSRFVEPTLVLNPRNDSLLMTEEIFGPILPIVTWEKIEDVVKYINERPKPLALYYFGKDDKNRQILETQTSSGAFCVNEAIFHVANSHLPFGGVGNSGMGSYHGQWGFDGCSHLKPVFSKAAINTYPFSTRFPPYTDSKKSMITFLFKNIQFNQSSAVRSLQVLASIIFMAVVNKKANLGFSFQTVQQYLAQLFSNMPKL